MIYVVDDDPAIRDALSLLLETEGYKVSAHASALTFLDEFKGSGEAGCVVTDMRMPTMTGIELLDVLKQRHASLPIISITAHGDVPLAVEAMKKGASDFFESLSMTSLCSFPFVGLFNARAKTLRVTPRHRQFLPDLHRLQSAKGKSCPVY